MRRRFVGGPLIGLLLAIFLLHAPGAAAVIEWCRADPVVEIGGTRLHVYVSGPVEILDAATGPTVVEIAVPPGVPATLISTDPGFGHGWDVRFVESDTLDATRRRAEVQVSAYVPATADLDILIQVTDGTDFVLAEAMGTTNSWGVVNARLRLTGSRAA